MKFSIKDLFSNVSNPREAADFVTFNEEVFNGKLHFLCSINKGNLKKITNALTKDTFMVLCHNRTSANSH